MCNFNPEPNPELDRALGAFLVFAGNMIIQSSYNTGAHNPKKVRQVPVQAFEPGAAHANFWKSLDRVHQN